MPMSAKTQRRGAFDVVAAIDYGHHLESLAVAFTVCALQSLLLFGLRIDSWMHETANFLEHYARASAGARMPVNVVAAIFFGLNLVVVVIARRIKEASDHA